MRNYRELIAWQVAFELAGRIYRLTASFPADERFGLTSQMRRSAVSVVSNIAEGAGRGSKPDFAHFLAMARGSLNELETQYLLANELGFCKTDEETDGLVERVYGLINGLRNSLNA